MTIQHFSIASLLMPMRMMELVQRAWTAAAAEN
jgi:hypothetical protein